MRIILSIISIFYTLFCFSQNSRNIPFKSEERICFVGNSITHDGGFFHNIQLYHITRFPDRYVTFINCGIAGDVTGGVLDRIEQDILLHKPSYAVIMLGMNDVDRSLYGPYSITNIDTLRKRSEALTTYQKNLETIVKTFLSKDIRVILETPTIYDQTVLNTKYNNLGVNDALEACAGFIKSLAKKYQLPIVDYWSIMNRINCEMQKRDPGATITGNDRIHPGNTGHFVMGHQFLETLGAPQCVSSIIIDKNKILSSKMSKNCIIKDIKRSNNTISLTVLENALPFPANSTQNKGLQLVPFTRNLNVELIRIEEIEDEDYSLFIDSVFIGDFTGKQLRNGINLSNYPHSPQFQQALSVREVLEELWVNEKKIRDLKFIEANRYFKFLKETTNNKISKHSLDSIFKENYTSSMSYRLSKSKEYFENKPFENDFQRNIELLQKEAYRLAQPVEHTFLFKLKKDE